MPSAQSVLDELARSAGLAESATPFAAVVAASGSLSWTRDPFDRMICAQAVVDGDTLLTRDRRIRAHLESARWDEDG